MRAQYRGPVYAWLLIGLLALAGCEPVTVVPGSAGQATAAPFAATALAVAPTPASHTATAAVIAPSPSAEPSATGVAPGVASPGATPVAAAPATAVVVVSTPAGSSLGPPLSSITTTPPAVAAAPPPVNGTLTITLENNGATVNLKRGDRFVLMLGEGYDWTVTPDDQNVVSRVINITPLRGSQGVYEAHRAGQTMVNASGDPLCRQSRPACGQPSIAFRLKVVVQ